MPIESSEEAERATESGNWSSSRLPVLWNWYHWGHFGARWGTAVLAGKKRPMTPDMWHPQQPAKPRQATKNTMQNSTAGVMAEVRVAWDMMGWMGYRVPVLAFAKCSQFNNNYWGKLRSFGRMIYQKVLNYTLSYKWTKYRFWYKKGKNSVEGKRSKQLVIVEVKSPKGCLWRRLSQG